MGVATQNGRKTPEGIAPGDRLLGVKGAAISGATMGMVLRRLHGGLGETRQLTHKRREQKFVVKLRVTNF
jgi:C-terminal processing protease CtpA/Prc